MKQITHTAFLLTLMTSITLIGANRSTLKEPKDQEEVIKKFRTYRQDYNDIKQRKNFATAGIALSGFFTILFGYDATKTSTPVSIFSFCVLYHFIRVFLKDEDDIKKEEQSLIRNCAEKFTSEELDFLMDRQTTALDFLDPESNKIDRITSPSFLDEIRRRQLIVADMQRTNQLQIRN